MQMSAKRFAGITIVKDYKHSSSSLGDSEATPIKLIKIFYIPLAPLTCQSSASEEEATSDQYKFTKKLSNPHYTSIILFLSTLLVATVLDFVRRFPVSEKSSTWTFPSCVSCVPSVWDFQHHIHARAGDNSTFCQLLILLSELFSSIYLSIYLSIARLFTFMLEIRSIHSWHTLPTLLFDFYIDLICRLSYQPDFLFVFLCSFVAWSSMVHWSLLPRMNLR